MKRKLLTFILFLCTFLVRQNVNAQTTLAPGDIAFIGYQTLGPDGFSFITLKDMSAGTLLYLTEKGWGNGAWATSTTEPHLLWTVPAFTPAGTVVSIIETATADTFAVTGTTLASITLASGVGFNLSGGDQMLAYQSATGPQPASPTFIAGVHGDYNLSDYDTTTTWNTAAGSNGGNESSLPPGLTNGTNCVSLFPGTAEIANSKYNGTLTGSVASLLSSINNYQNWSHSATVDLGIVPSSYPTPVVSTVVVATVTTTTATSVKAVTAVIGGNVTVTGGDANVERGIVWATTAAPTIANNKVQNGTGIGTFSATITGLPSATLIHYRAYSTNSAGTSYGAELTFNTGAALDTSATPQTNVTCFGATTGAASVTVTGGTLPYSYSWSPSGGSAAAATSLAAGTYTVTITDGESTQITRSFTITERPVILGVPSTTAVSCFGGTTGTATIVASGGTPGYTYSWSPSGGSGAMATGLAAGTYSVTITDANSCSKTISGIVVGGPTAALSGTSSSTPVSCFGGNNGTATAIPNGGTPTYTYLWSNGSTAATATSLTAGTYTVTITDAKGCTFTITNISVGSPAAAVSGTTSTTPVSCFGGSNGTATVVPAGGTGTYTYVWSPSGGTGATASGLTAGTYSVIITDANACTATINSIVVGGAAAALTATSSTTPVSCFGGTNGTATVTPSGGTGTYTYAWSPSGGTGATASGLTAGTYSVTVTDANSCFYTINNIAVTGPTVITANPTQINVSCNGGSNGTATVAPSGGSGSYTYLWSNGATTATASGLVQGNYSVTITDANLCPITQNFTITQPTSLVASQGTISNVSCNGGSNASATVAVAGGSLPYSYSWAPTGGTGATASGLTAGTYTVTVTDNNACQTTQSFTITQPSTLVANAAAQTNILCNGAATGSATVNVTGGTGAYTYSWAPSGGTAATATGLTAGTYTVTVKDANLCQTTQSFTITQPSTLVATASAQTNIGCRGDATGSATVNVTGGTGAYTYSWAPSGGTAATATGLIAGTYTVTVKDANLCQTTQSFTITQPAAILSATTASLGVSCFGGSNGSAGVTASGGTPGYTYLWAPLGGTSATITGRPAGNYTCTITDSNGCTLVKNITINTPAVLSATTIKTDVSCNGGTNGSATVTVSGGTPGYTYSWAPTGGTAATATGLAAGTYTVTVTDANTCQTTATVTINQPATLAVTSAQTNVLCNGGASATASVVVSGGTPGYTYVWSPSGGTSSTAVGLTVGNYSCLITDANGCSFTKSFTITQPAVLSATTSQVNATCVTAGQAGVTVSGGTSPYNYIWSPSGGTAAIATGLLAGNYNCLITDANGCTLSKNFTITSTNTLTATQSQTNVLCNGTNTATATVVPSGAPGPYTYVWAPSGGTAATATGLTAGNYSVTITSTNGCSIVKNFTITQPSAMVVTPSQTNLTCNGGTNGSASVSVTGGTGAYTYVWSPSGGTAATATGLTAGTYTVTITDANLCQTTQAFTITEPIALTATIAPTNVSCNGGTTGAATVTPTGGTGTYTYTWAPSGGTAATATGLTAGTYTVTVTDANSCTTTQSVTITEPAQLVASVGGQTDVTCNGLNNGSATVNVTGGTATYTYAWAPSGGIADTATGLSPGTYTVTVTDANSCTATQSFIITEPAVLTTAITAQTDVLCNGGTTGDATVTATGGTGTYTYAWAPSGGTAATATGLTAGTYTVTVTDTNSCTATQSVTITEPSALTATIAPTNVSCNGGTTGAATVTATGGTGTYTYAWAPSGGTAATATGLTAGAYTVTVTDANSCTTTQSVTISEPNIINTTITKTNVSCNGGTTGSATVTATGGTGVYSYAWSPSGGTAATATGLTAGNYTVTVTDANSCTTTQSVSITEPTAITATITPTNVSCNGGTTGAATVTATGGTGTYTYAWAPSGGTAATATGLTAGNYAVTLTDANSCTTTQSVTITEPIALTAIITPTNVSCNGGTTGSATVTATGGTGIYTYAWSPSGGTANTATGLAAGTYTVTISDANNCTTNQSVTITEPSVLVASIGAQTNISCNAGSNGTATVSASGGTGPYTYAWSPSGGNNAIASGLNAGTYTVTVTDANNCNATQVFNITEPAVLASNIVSQTNVSCSGLNDGAVTVNVTGGVAPYTYLWSNGITTKDISGLTAGNYTLTITDTNSCSITQSVAILTIPDVTPPVPTVANLSEITSYCSILSSQIPIPTATDNCAGIINGITSNSLNYTTDGSYVITWSFDDGSGNISTQNQTITVIESPIDQVTFSSAEYTFDGNEHTLQVANLPAGASVAYATVPATETNNGATNAGVYTITATITPSAEAPNCSPVILTADLTINKATQQITFEALAPRILGSNNDFNLEALSNSGLPIRFSFTYTSTLPPANVSASGVVNMLRSGELQITANQDGNENYLPAPSISQVLIIKNNDVTVQSIAIGSKVYNNPADDITYLMSCGENNPNVAIVNQTNATITPAASFTIDTPKPGIYTQNVTVTSQDGTATANYTIKVEKPFGFYDIVKQKFNNVLLINNNPQTNGGYQFVSYQWFKNGQLVGTGQYYSAGNEPNAVLDPLAIYSVKMTTLDGKVLQTCDANIVLQNSLQAKLYPNPIEVGKVITVEADFPQEELQNMQITLYSVSGKLIKTVQSSNVITEIQLPETTGSSMYLVVLETDNIKKSFKVIVK